MSHPRPAARVLVAATGALMIAAACGTTTTPPATSSPSMPATSGPSATPTTPAPSATPVDAGSIPTTWPIKHVVFLMMENRTFDNLFGRFPGADGATFGWDHGTRRPLTRATV